MSTPRFLRRALTRRHTDGQALAEFAIILPILLLLVGGIIQYGALIATSHSLTQIGRDVGRWAATQDFDPDTDLSCSVEAGVKDEPVTQADLIAQQSGLMGYRAGMWDASVFVIHPDGTDLDLVAPLSEGVEVVWSGDPCPTTDSTETAWVTVRVSHHAPVLLPGLAYLPGIGTCDGSGCYLEVHSTAQFRVEPPPAP